MNKREIFDAYFVRHNKHIERMPLIEYAPYWDQTLERWYAEGLDNALEPDRIQALMGLDPLWYTTIDPGGEGWKEPPHGAPVIYSEEEYEALLPCIYPADPFEKVRDFVLARKEESDRGDYLFELNLNGFFWWPRTLLGIENHLVAFYEQPELYHRICRDLLTYNITAVKRFLEQASPAFILLGEDMSYNHGPMIGKAMWDEFLKPYYLAFLKEMKALGQTVIYDSDGMVESILPWLVECGFDGILPLERMAGVDINRLTEQYPTFKFIGGFDKTVMKDGEEAMRREFERIYPAMKRGCYVPCVDHQTPPDVSLENYRIYLRLLREYATKVVKEA